MRTVVSKILESKLNPPAPLRAQVLRMGIAEQIATAVGRLVLVQAPAGYGKTTTMAQARDHIESRNVATAWLTLDRADNDVTRFLECLGKALQRLGIEDAERQTHFDPAAALCAHDQPFVLFLDDFEVVQEPAVLSLVRELIERLPHGGQLILGSRGRPDIGLGRLRARGHLVEIDMERLRFSLEETTAYFALRTRQAVSPELLAVLHAKTEGWIAALWLACMAMEQHGPDPRFVARFSGAEGSVADYLAEDVLSGQAPEVRDFLLRTSILRQLDESVCQALNPQLDCAHILEQLDAANLFLTRISGGPRSWRYHSLFGDFLRSQLMRERPDEITRLHLAASGWYESNERPVPAIDHAIDGGDYPHALSLLEGRAEQFLDQGRMRKLSRWFSVTPEALLQQHPVLHLIAIWAACFTQGPWTAMERLERSGYALSESPGVRSTALAMVPCLLAMQDRYDEAYEVGRQRLGPADAVLPFAEAAYLNTMSNILSVMGRPHESHRLLDAARSTQAAGTFNRMYTEALEGLHDLLEGRLRQATARFRMAVDSTHTGPRNLVQGNAYAGVFYASVVFEANDLAAAKHLLSTYLPIARDIGLADHMIMSHVMRSRIGYVEGDVDTASQALTELEYLGHVRQLPRVVASAKLERSRMLLLQGNGPASHQELLRASDVALWERERRQRLPAHDLDYLALAQARWEIHFGDVGTAIEALDREIVTATKDARERRLLKLRTLRALAWKRSGALPLAFEEISAVLEAAKTEGYQRLLLDEGPEVGVLIQRCYADRQSRAQGHESDPILAESVHRLLKAFGPLPSEDEGAPLPARSPQEPLSTKELRVLQLLAEGYSNAAMADKLCVSDSTVRTHLRSVNLKLATKSRTQAVAVGRKLGLIR